MPSPYSMLIKKPIKEDLVKWLDEAVWNEKESTKENDGSDPATDPQDNGDQGEADPLAEAHTKIVTNEVEKTDNDATIVDIDGSPLDVHQTIKVQDRDPLPVQVSNAAAVEPSVNAAFLEDSIAASMGGSITKSQHMTLHNVSSVQDLRYNEKNKEAKPSIEDVKFSPSEQNNQVFEVSPALGCEIPSFGLALFKL